MTEGLKLKIETFEKSGEINFTPAEMVEFKKYCQETFRFSIDISCSRCVCDYVNKTINYLKTI